MRILFLSRWYPFPPNNGSKIRIYNLLQGLAEHHKVSLISFADPSEISAEVEKPSFVLDEVRTVPWRPFNPQSNQAKAGFFSQVPRAYLDTFSQELADHILDVLGMNHYDLVIASQIDMAAYADYFQGLPALFEEAEVGVLYEQFRHADSIAKRFRYWLTWIKHKRFLASTLQHFRACTVVSDKEKQLLSQAVPDHPTIHIIPNAIDFSTYRDIREIPEEDTIIFTGSLSFEPNYEAMVWFVGEVFPIILDEIPEVRLTITGDHQGRSLPFEENVVMTGFVDDVRPLISRSWCSVVPILSGGGTRLKILEAMALSTPVISTTKGAEGLDLTPGDEILLADKPKEFANQVIAILKNPEIRQRLASRGQKQVKGNYNWPAIMPDFISLLEEIVK